MRVLANSLIWSRTTARAEGRRAELTAITRAARRAASGGRVAAESVTVDSAVVRRVQFEDHGVEVLAIQRVCAGENRGGLASSRRPVEEQVRQLSCVDQASDSRDDVLVRDEVGHVLGTVPVRGASRRPGEYTEGREREQHGASALFHPRKRCDLRVPGLLLVRHLMRRIVDFHRGRAALSHSDGDRGLARGGAGGRADRGLGAQRGRKPRNIPTS